MCRWADGWFHGSLPVGTLLVNVLGCFIIGLVFGLMEKTDLLTPAHSLLLATGFCGGFTTFSSFANELYRLANGGSYATGILYLAASVTLGILLLAFGRAIVR